MLKVGRRIYYDVFSGSIILTIEEREGNTFITSVEQDITVYKVLSERNRETFDFIELDYGQHAQDFAESNGYRVNPDTIELEFSYPDPNEPEEEQPYQAPISETINMNTEYLIDVDFRLSIVELGL